MLQLGTLLLQIAIILTATWLTGWLFRKIHQPQVVGEMAAGILLGPSLLGWLAPDVFAALFPLNSLGHLNVLSQISLLSFMFLVGLNLDPQSLRGRERAAWITSHTSIIVPFALGMLLAYFLYPRVSDGSVRFLHFALFMGTAMSITAFPVLAHILTEYKLLNTRLGAMTIVCAAVDDVTAWLILAAIMLLVHTSGETLSLWLALPGTALYVVGLWFVVRPALRRLVGSYRADGRITKNALTLVILLLLVSALLTEGLGIHALFGAFFAGAIMPKDREFIRALKGHLEGVTVLLLPLFFTFTGLRTSIGMLDSSAAWLECVLITSVAIIGKFGGATVGAHIAGTPWREATAIGILMNTRGLMELVVLNIGLEVGVIPQKLFTMMVLMALVTTGMTVPLLKLFYFAEAEEKEFSPEAAPPRISS